MARAPKIISTPNNLRIYSVYGPRLLIDWLILLPPYIIKNIGSAVPMLYAKVTITAYKVTAPVAANVVIVARIGPAHGVQTNPKAAPNIIPENIPVLAAEACCA